MFVRNLVASAIGRTLLLGITVALAASAIAQTATPPPASSGVLPDTPMPQAQPRHHNEHLYSDQDYSKPKSAFPNVIAPYTVRDVPPPNFTNSARIDQLIKDGKMYLSLDDAVAMALENNLDLTIQRYNLSIADVDLLRTKAGAVTLGVNAGLVQGTPGGAGGSTSSGGTGSSSTGASGTGAGGTQLGVGGAGAGAAGIVSSTAGEGPPIDSFDPILSGNIQGEHQTAQQSSTVFTGTTTLVQDSTLYNFNYSQGFSTGTLATVSFDNNRTVTNSLFSFVSPQLVSSFRFQLRQHLMQGFGTDPNLRFIHIARNNREIEDVTFRNQIITTVSQIENIYWDLVTAYEAVKVNERALQLAEKTQSDDEEEIRIGTLAPITLVQAQSGVATAKQNLIVSQTNLQLEQLFMKNAITKNMGDPILAVAPVVPTDTLQLKEQLEVRPVEDLIQEALQTRPEVTIARIDLTNRSIGKRAIRSLLRPTVDLYAFYGASSLGGPQNPLFPSCSDPNSIPGECYTPGIIPVGYNTTFTNLFNSTAPDKGIGVNINIPLRNRQVQADQVRSQLEYRQAEVNLQQIENNIAIQVRQAQFALQQNYAALQAATAARDYAQESLTAEQKKFGYGASTPTLVLQASSNLTLSESNLLNAAANYEKSKVTLDLVTAETLTKLGIDMADAESGRVKHEPKIPGILPGNVESNPSETTVPPVQSQPETPPPATTDQPHQ